jgi:hypothetical protein
MIEQAILVRDQTALEQLIARFNTFEQARFYIEHAGGNFQPYIDAHLAFKRSLDFVIRTLEPSLKYQVLFREFLPNFIFAPNQIVLALGRDGLVANVAKYVNGIPIIGINPDPGSIDGKLCRFEPEELPVMLKRIFKGAFNLQEISMAEAVLNDGQRLLAFNDLFVGPVSHTSARYELSFGDKQEVQSSSGIIISTGVGASGWLSSIYNMAQGVNQLTGNERDIHPLPMQWDSKELVFVVREPFQSKSTFTSLIGGKITAQKTLTISSNMPAGGCIFSDGIEKDFLQFNAGAKAEISVAKEKAFLVDK